LLRRKKLYANGLIDMNIQNVVTQFTAFFIFSFILQIFGLNPGHGLPCNWGFKTFYGIGLLTLYALLPTCNTRILYRGLLP
jgi:hypothetical protein